jgi:hypothetical protein
MRGSSYTAPLRSASYTPSWPVAQLAGTTSKNTAINFFPDYNEVGSLNYAKLLEAACCPCTFWLLPDWKTLLQKHGNNFVWQNTLNDFHPALPRLQAARITDAVQELCVSLSMSGLALKHEAIWLLELSK